MAHLTYRAIAQNSKPCYSPLLMQWRDLPQSVRVLLEHTFHCILTDICFLIVFWFVKFVPLTGWLQVIFSATEQILLVVVTLYFAVVAVYDLTQERLHALVRFFRSHNSVFA